MVRQTDKRDYRTVFLIGLAVLMAVCLSWLVMRPMVGPRLFALDVDIATYMPGQVIERVVRLENRGSGELLIHDVKTCCGLSLPYGFPKRIPAKSADVIVLRFRAPDSPVPLEKDFALHTNDPINPVKRVFVRGLPDLPFYASPPRIDLAYIVPGENVEKAVAFLTPDNDQAALSFSTSSPHIHISSPRSVPPRRFGDKEYNTSVVDVSVGKDTPRGPMQEYILVKTGCVKHPYVVVPVKGIVERGLRVRPEQVFFGMVAGESIVNRIIRLEVIGPGWDSIKIGPSGFSGISAKLQQKSEKKFELHVSLDPAKMPKRLKSYLTLENISGDTLQIPVLALHKTL